MAVWALVAIRDQAINAFMRPWAVPHTGAALRHFSDEVNAKEPNDLNKHPSDYTIWHMADYDDATGNVSQMENQPTMIGRAIDFAKLMEMKS